MPHRKVRDDLVASAIGAKAHFQVFWALANEALPQLVGPMNDHSDFFQASRQAHYTAFFVHLAHLYDKRPDSSSISTYLTRAQGHIDSAVLQGFEARYVQLAARAQPLIVARHKTVAHIDANLSEKQVFAGLNVKWNEIKSVIYDSAQFVADLAGATSPGDIGIPHDRRLIDSTLRLIRALGPARA